MKMNEKGRQFDAEQNVLLERLSAGKVQLRRERARLPIEEKLRIMIELQKIELTIRPSKGPEDRRRVWEI